jgi:hypothetical protein
MPKRLWLVGLILLCGCLSLAGSLGAQDCPAPAEAPKTGHAPIHNVLFLNDGLLDKQTEASIARDVRLKVWPKNASGEFSISTIADEAAERVRAAYQDDGYFKVTVEGKAMPFAGDKSQYDIVVKIGPVGKQYRMGDFDFANVTVFPESQLRDLFPIERGEIFSQARIAEGLKKLMNLYGSEGYINFTSVPNTEFDDESGRADLRIEVDEGKQFRLRNIEVLGADPETKAKIVGELGLTRGQILDSEAWTRSLAATFGGSSDPVGVDKHLDENAAMVDVIIDLRTRPCPQTCQRRNWIGECIDSVQF